MAKINVTLRDDVREFESGITVAEIAKSIGAGLYKAACAAKIDTEVCDLRTPLTKDCKVSILTFDAPEGKHAFWHTGSHVLAEAAMRLYPQSKLTIGPAIENGFYYDIDSDTVFTPEILEKLEAEMRKIVKEDQPISRFVLSRADALEKMKHDEYKLELINELPADSEISFYEQGGFTDLCAGPHLMSTGPLAAVKLMNVTGAYWRADAKNKMLQRIYGIAFPKASLLTDYLVMLEEAKKRDHRKLGRELELFDIYDEGPGFPFFLPKGMILRNELENMWREEHRKAGYKEIKTPIMLNRELWETSGHWDHYKNNMYTTVIDGEDFAIKPMNCPGGMLVYKSKLMSYRDLPFRCGELGLVHRHELSGALHGLMRVRCFTQDDAHIFMTEDQIEDEILGVAHLIDKFYKMFGFEYTLELSTRPADFMGEAAQWDKAENALKSALDKNGMPYEINEGDGAFYGPKIDFHLKDCLGRTWQCGTIQLDFQMPERFDVTYVGADGEKHRPVMIHRVVFGSIERFIGILTEQFAGAFPLWLAPVQAMVIPISENHRDYASQIAKSLEDAGIRVECDSRSEKMGYKIREAQMQKIPYMLVVGDKEREDGTVSVRSRSRGDTGTHKLEEFIDAALLEIKTRAL
ncbi:MAG: threonine--tRNA ligase [Oscillospiraceae bacterium]